MAGFIAGMLWLSDVSTSYYFSTALRSYDVTETVYVGNNAYSVENGTVHSEGSVLFGTGRALRVAYALTLARRSPLATIAGTDPERLAAAVERLEIQIALLQKLPAAAGEESYNREEAVYALYPTRFLKALAEAELLRQKFLQDRSEESARRYDTGIMRALKAGRSDIRLFKEPFAEVAADNPTSIADIGGTFSPHDLTKAVGDIEKKLEQTQKLMGKRIQCKRGLLSVCNPYELALPTVLSSEEAPAPSAKTLATAAEVRSLFASAISTSSLRSGPMILLPSSTCMRTVPGAALFTASPPPNSRTLPLPYYLNDLFFTDTSINAPMLNYLRTTLSMSYSFLNPLMFYHCPDVGMEISDVVAASYTRYFILENAGGLTQKSAYLFGQYFSTTEAQNILLQTLSVERDPAILNQALELLLMFKNRGAGLDSVVNSIADTQNSHLQVREHAPAFDTSLHILFLAQSAFPSLFQAYNPSFSAQDALVLRTANTIDTTSHARRYTELRTNTPRTTFLHDLQAYFSFERDGYSAERLKQTGIDMQCPNCVVKALAGIRTTDGLTAAFRVLKSYYLAVPETRKDCHDIATKLGAITAREVSDFHMLDLGAESTWCNYGFYQEYPRSMLVNKNTPKEAAAFCTYVENRIGAIVPRVGGECFRGLGQSFPFLSLSLIGNASAITSAAVTLCKSLTSTETNYKLCAAGVFFGVGKAMYSQEYGLSINAGDPLSICKEQEPSLLQTCQENIVKSGILSIGKEYAEESLQQQFDRVKQLYPGVSVEAVPELIWVLAYAHLRIHLDQLDTAKDAAKECRPFPLSLRNECVRGFSLGLAKHGIPNEEHVAILELCQRVSGLISIDKTLCAKKGFDYLEGAYSPLMFTNACTEARKTLGNVCN